MDQRDRMDLQCIMGLAIGVPLGAALWAMLWLVWQAL